MAAGVPAAHAELLALARRSTWSADFGGSVMSAVGLAVRVDGWCVIGFDPVSGLRSMMYSRNGVVCGARRLARNEHVEVDLHRYVDLARSPIPVGIVRRQDADAGRSPRLREILLPAGFTSELRVALHTRGVLWGALSLFRSDNLVAFGERDARAITELIDPLVHIIRRYTTRRADRPAAPLPTGVLIVAPDDTIVAATAAADRCVDELTPGGNDELTSEDSLRIVYDATARARHPRGDQPATTVLRTPSGRWLAIHAAEITADAGTGDIAVTLGPAEAAQLLPSFARWHGLTGQEQNVVQLLTAGLSTRQIAHRLDVSVYTAQDHLKAIYRKTGNIGRSELIATLT